MKKEILHAVRQGEFIAKFFHAIGYIEAWGTGTQFRSMIQRELAKLRDLGLIESIGKGKAIVWRLKCNT